MPIPSTPSDVQALTDSPVSANSSQTTVGDAALAAEAQAALQALVAAIDGRAREIYEGEGRSCDLADAKDLVRALDRTHVRDRGGGYSTLTDMQQSPHAVFQLGDSA